MIDYLGRRPTREKLLRGEPVKWVDNCSRGDYIRSVILSCPPWADLVELRMLRAWTRVMTIFTGIPHQLDHIVPLNNPRVCGLTVPWNLQVVPARVNNAKSGSWYEWHGDIFAQPGQIPLLPTV